jgi:predicted TIM-barrel fold metal-dependent hydrolase
MDDERCWDEIGLPRFETVLKDFPTVDFVAHAQGWWAHIESSPERMGGYETSPIDRLGRCAELLSRYDNCYADISARSGWNALTRDHEVGQRFLENHYSKLVFGTDFFYESQDIPQLELFEQFELTHDMRTRLCEENITELLR